MGMCLCCLVMDMGLNWNSANAMRFCLLIKSQCLSARGKMIIPKGNMGTRVQTGLITEKGTNKVKAFSEDN